MDQLAEMAAAKPVGRPRTRAAMPDGYDDAEQIAARRQYMAAYKLANKERLKAYYAAWRAEHRPQMLAANRAYHAREAAKKRLARQLANEGRNGLDPTNASPVPE